MAFSFTSISNFVFDQVLSFTLMNVLKNNQQDIHDSLDTEHEFSTGEHKRITEGSNLLINSTGRRGLQFFPSSDWSPVPYINNNAVGPMWTNASDDGSANTHKSIPISPITDGQNMTLSFQLNLAIDTRIAGQVSVQLQAFTAGDAFISNFAQLTFTANEPGFETFEVTGITPATTAYIKFNVSNTLDATTVSVFIRRVKVEKGLQATYYSDEASFSQYLSARRTSDNGTQVLTSGVLFNVIFENPTSDSDVFDDPGSDRYSTGTGFFTADRYMKLRVSVALLLDSAPWTANTIFEIRLYKTPFGAGEALYAIFSRAVVEVATAKAIHSQGSTLIELNNKDKFRIRAFQTSGTNKPIAALSSDNYIDIEEI